MNGDHRTPRRTLAGIASLAAAALFAATSLVLAFSAVGTPAAPAGPDAVPAAPTVEESPEDWYQQDLPDDGWLWDDDAFDDDTFDHWPAAPDEDVSPFAATTSDDPLNFLAEVYPAV